MANTRIVLALILKDVDLSIPNEKDQQEMSKIPDGKLRGNIVSPTVSTRTDTMF